MMSNMIMIKMIEELQKKGEELILVKLAVHPDCLEFHDTTLYYKVVSKKVGDGCLPNNHSNFSVRTWVVRGGEGHFEGGYFGDSLNESPFADYKKICEFSLR